MLQSMGSQRVGHNLATEQQIKHNSKGYSSLTSKILTGFMSISQFISEVLWLTVSINLYSSNSPLNQSYQLSDSHFYDIINNNKTFNIYLFWWNIFSFLFSYFFFLLFENYSLSHCRKTKWYIYLCLVTQSCPTLCDPVDCSPPGSCVHRDSPGKNIGVGCHALLQIFTWGIAKQFFLFKC